MPPPSEEPSVVSERGAPATRGHPVLAGTSARSRSRLGPPVKAPPGEMPGEFATHFENAGHEPCLKVDPQRWKKEVGDFMGRVVAGTTN